MSKLNIVYKYNGHTLSYCNSEEYETLRGQENLSYLFCAKHPYHKQIVGYEKNCDKEHPEYLVADRPELHCMALNMIDVNDEKYYSDTMIMAGLDFIQRELDLGRDVVVVGNKGESKSPTMCLMYLMARGIFETRFTFIEVFKKFRYIVPQWNPSTGIYNYAIKFWNKVRKGELNEKA